jgi:hypothetical protein
VLGRMSQMGVRRDKAALSSGCESHPATAPALLSLPEDWSRLMRDHQPAALMILEYVGHEGIEAQDIPVLS